MGDYQLDFHVGKTAVHLYAPKDVHDAAATERVLLRSAQVIAGYLRKYP